MPLHSGQAVFSDPAILSSVDGPRHSSCSGSCSDPHSVFTTGIASHYVMTLLACAEACTAIICHASFTLLSIKAYPLISLLTFSDPQLFSSDPCARLLAVKSTAWYVPSVDFCLNQVQVFSASVFLPPAAAACGSGTNPTRFCPCSAPPVLKKHTAFALPFLAGHSCLSLLAVNFSLAHFGHSTSYMTDCMIQSAELH